ncbi:hypothetical protein M8J77_002088 [Diaphorina citri]|nr:hypothetical protein M8J77_002088 [Diaphorina citri]
MDPRKKKLLIIAFSLSVGAIMMIIYLIMMLNYPQEGGDNDTQKQKLADDFAIIHPDAHNRFTQKYGDIKSKILSRLHDHHSDKARNLIDFATVGEDEADVATFQAITYLLRRMHTFSVQGAKKKTVNPSRDQVLNSFLPHVPTVGDIPACLCLATRTKHVESFKEFVVPFIVAVGPSWRQVQQYDLVISKTVNGVAMAQAGMTRWRATNTATEGKNENLSNQNMMMKQRSRGAKKKEKKEVEVEKDVKGGKGGGGEEGE